MKFHHSSLLFVVACALFAQERPVKFAGEVRGVDAFRHDIGHGLIFALASADGGWELRIEPTGAATPGCAEYSWVVMPPYRGYNERYLYPSYGFLATEIAKPGVRDFRFVLTAEDCKRESEWVSRLLWSYSYTEQQVDEAQKKLGTSPVGKGTLRIIQSGVSPSGELIEGKDYGKIDWLKFEVTIAFPPKR
jgi:hypothetical protein